MKTVRKINEKLPKTCIAFSSIINRKDRKDIDRNVAEANQRLSNYCNKKILIILKIKTPMKII